MYVCVREGENHKWNVLFLATEIDICGARIINQNKILPVVAEPDQHI